MRFARLIAISIAIALLCLVNSAPGYAATTPHGCGQPTPPPVPGTPGIPPATPGIVLINEILNSPGSTWNCAEPAKTYSLLTDAWVELYNPQSQPFNLYTAHTSLDAGPNTFTFHFPFGAAIAAHGYLVVFPNTYAGMLNAGNNLRLTIGGTAIDQVSIPALATDTSYARIPDGSANWQITTNPTIDASNMASTVITPTPVSTKRSGSSGGDSGGSTSNGYATPTLVTGKQTAWTNLQLPATNSTATSLTNSSIVSKSVTAPTSNTGDVPRRILLTALLVALALSLFWWWKQFVPR